MKPRKAVLWGAIGLGALSFVAILGKTVHNFYNIYPIAVRPASEDVCESVYEEYGYSRSVIVSVDRPDTFSIFGMDIQYGTTNYIVSYGDDRKPDLEFFNIYRMWGHESHMDGTDTSLDGKMDRGTHSNYLPFGVYSRGKGYVRSLDYENDPDFFEKADKNAGKIRERFRDDIERLLESSENSISQCEELK